MIELGIVVTEMVVVPLHEDPKRMGPSSLPRELEAGFVVVAVGAVVEVVIDIAGTVVGIGAEHRDYYGCCGCCCDCLFVLVVLVGLVDILIPNKFL